MSPLDPSKASSIDTQRATLDGAWQSALLAIIGMFILLGVGFAGMQQIHDAAHDTRHGFSFPCH